MKHHHQIVFGFMRNIAWNLTLAGGLSLLTGILIFIYPAFLAILVSALLIVVGLLFLALAFRAWALSKIDLDL